jgi:hypothetical protein
MMNAVKGIRTLNILQIFLLFFLITGIFVFSLSMPNQSDATQAVETESSVLKAQSSSTLYQKEWNITFGDTSEDRGKSICVDSDGSIYVTGALTNGDAQILVAKYDSSGTQIWNVTWGGPDNDFGTAIAVDPAKNIYVTGLIGGVFSDLVVVKFDPNGNYIWNKTYDSGASSDTGSGIAYSSLEQRIYVCGDDADNILLFKYDTDGNLIWKYEYDSGSADWASGLCISDDFIYVSGKGGALNDALLLKHHKNNVSHFVKLWGGPLNEIGRSVAVDSTGNVYLTGYTKSFSLGQEDVFLAKFDELGNSIWNRTWGDLKIDRAEGIAIDANDDIYICAETSNYGAGSFDIAVLKYDSDGNQPWSAIWGGAFLEYVEDIALSGTDIYVVGITDSFGAGGNDGFILKYKQNTPQNIPGFEWVFLFVSVFSLLIYSVSKRLRKNL